MLPWLEAVVANAHTALMGLQGLHPARQYLTERGVSDDQLRELRIGWLPDPHGITACSPEFWAWVQRYGWDRIIFPITNPLGAVTGLQVRRAGEKGYEDHLAQPSELTPACFGLHVALPAAFASNRLIVVEGVFDYLAIRPYAADVIAMLTSSAGLVMRRLLARYAKTVVCLTDMDAAGRRGAHRLAGLPIPEQFLKPGELQPKTKVPPFHVLIPSYNAHDPSDLRKAGLTNELQRLSTLGRIG